MRIYRNGRSFVDYDITVWTELSMKLLEGDIHFLSSRYYIPGYDQEDLKQELRLLMWQKIPMFDHTKGILLRTWANTLIRNRLKNMLRDNTRKKRWNGETLPIIDDFSLFYGRDIEYQHHFENLLDLLHENGMTIEDFF